MPIATEPNQTFRVVLEIDKDKPAGEQPYFEFRFLSVRRWNREARASAQLRDPIVMDGMSAEEATNGLLDMIKVGLINWGNVRDLETGEVIPFDPNNLDRALTLLGTSELLAKFRNQGLDVEDKKKSGSQSDLGMEQLQAARDALEPQSAEINPTPSSP